MSMNIKAYWENRLSNQFDLSGVGFTQLGKQYNRWLYRVRKAVFHQKIKPLPEDVQNAHVLDIGVGTGFYVERWQELGVSQIVGLDLTETAVSHLRRRYPKYEFYQADIGGDLEPLTGKTFELISAFDVLFHIVDDALYQQALNNIYSLLKPGGFFIFSDNFLHVEPVVASHQVCRRLDTIQQWLTASQFEIVDRFPMFYLMNMPLDTRNVALITGWKVLNRLVTQSELGGFFVGALLYPLERLLIARFNESPTTEIMICRRPLD